MKIKMIALGILLLSSSLMLHAQNAEDREMRNNPKLGTVSTSAEARTRLPNTVADVTVAIETTGKDVASVTKALGERSQQLTGYLRQQGCERLRTGQVSVETQDHTAKTGVQSIVGYTGTVSLSFRVTQEKLGDVITGALTHGANRVDQTSLTARETEIDAARRQLVIEATKKAVAEAEAVAGAAGAYSVGVKSVNVGGGGYQPRPMPRMRAMKMEAAAPAQVEIAAGDQEINVSVSVMLTVSR